LSVSYERYEEIKHVVANTLKTGKVRNIPICCFNLALQLGIRCIPYSDLSLEKQAACIQLSGEGFTLDNTIYYNDYQLSTRVRFTIMHEIGHVLLGHIEDDDNAETEANFFAGYILVPPVLVFAHDKTNDIDQTQIKTLFNVSNPVAENTYIYYKKWSRRNKNQFGLSPVDIEIYDHFYNRNPVPK